MQLLLLACIVALATPPSADVSRLRAGAAMRASVWRVYLPLGLGALAVATALLVRPRRPREAGGVFLETFSDILV